MAEIIIETNEVTDILTSRLYMLQTKFDDTLKSVLSHVSTATLVDELSKRPGVEAFVLEPCEKKRFEFEGATTILNVYD